MSRRFRHPFALSDEIRTEAPPETILGIVRDPSTWPTWQSEIVAVDGASRLEAGDEVRGDARVIGFDVEGVSHINEVTASSLVEDVIVGVRMKVAYEVVVDGGATVIRRTVRTELPGGALGSLLTLVLKRKLRRMQRDLLRALSARASKEAPAQASDGL